MKRLRFKPFLALAMAGLLLTGCAAPSPGNTQTASPDSAATTSQADAQTTASSADPAQKAPAAQEKDASVRFISTAKLNVRNEANKSASISGTLLRGAQVKVLEKVKDSENKDWLKISYKDGAGEQSGFIDASYTADSREALLQEAFKGLDFSPVQKKEYPNNKRVKAKGIYLTLHSAGGERLDKLIALAKETGINAFVIDVKDDDGSMLFKTQAAEKYAPKANERTTVKDIGAFMKKLKDNNIYAIARIVSFKDPTYAKYNQDKVIIDKRKNIPFVNRDGIIWVSAHDRNLWDYNIAVAKEAAQAGFNEIQMDYVRFPASDNNKMDVYLDYRNTLNEGKPQTIQAYLKKAYEELSKEEVYLAADVYGLVGSVPDDMGLGQYWEAVSNYTDYICPMMYPSHYANGTYNIPVPDADPYKTLYYGTRDALARNQNIQTPAIIRPWIQSFTASWVKGHISYGPAQVKAQIKAMEELGVDEYLLWNASNRYDIQ